MKSWGFTQLTDDAALILKAARINQVDLDRKSVV
jgi:hypothetical protein